jgi:diguanylate cyclase (GGDEF)-like protein
VLNIDLNGLKVVNDQEGHEAGDRLLVQASEILKKVYYQDDLYRTGGDEFIVIMENINQDTFERKLEKLRSDAEKNSKVSFAIGEFWSDGSDDLTAAFRCADERMYADKNAYYDRHSELRRR